MLKITKKNKKKHKHKRGKGDDELFTPEELERYKQQQAEKAREQAAAEGSVTEAGVSVTSAVHPEEGSEQEGETATASNSDEWQRFKALTAGIDDVLKKSQGDLGRIKETSFFQRKPPGPSTEPPRGKKPPGRPAPPTAPDQRWVGFEEGARRHHEEETAESKQEVEENTGETPFEPEEQFEEEEEDEEPEDDGLFDTSYVDVVTSGDIKLAYIPESPTEEEVGDDPFDTSIVDKVIKPTEIITKDGKKKTLVSLGCAVDVLTGRLDKAIPIPQVVTAPGAKKRRVKPRDLLLDDGSLDTQVGDLSPPVLDSENNAISLLDDDGEPIPDDLPVDLPISIVAALPNTTEVVKETEVDEEKDNKPDLKNLVAEFDIISTTPDVELEEVLAKTPSDVSEDEFAALAAESIAKNFDPFDTTAADIALGVEEKKRVPDSPDVDVLLRGDSPSWDSTETLQKHPPRPPPPRPKQPASREVESEDPFDTTFAENLVPGKVELQIIENEILGGVATTQEDDDDDFDFDPRAGEEPASNVTIRVTIPSEDIQEDYIPEPVALKPAHRDLLGGSSTDLSQLVHEPIEPAGEREPEEIDPFDTSVVDALAPGKTELKYLEEEFLEKKVEEFCDSDFDPRVGEIAPAVEISSPSSRPDLLDEKADAPHKPLTPLSGNKVITDPSTPVDPFDTSIAENIAPGKAELKLLESELVQDSLVDDEFDPRAGIGDSQPIEQVNLPPAPPAERPDLLAVGEGEEAPHKPLTPATEELPTLEIDPFDTSLVSPVLAPGPAELRQLESELQKLPDALPSVPTPPIAGIAPQQVNPTSEDLLNVSANEASEAHRPLSPQQQEEQDIDPFDTSFAGDLLPGQTELRLLEAELIGQ